MYEFKINVILYEFRLNVILNEFKLNAILYELKLNVVLYEFINVSVFINIIKMEMIIRLVYKLIKASLLFCVCSRRIIFVFVSFSYFGKVWKEKFKHQRWSSIPPISTKRTITSHLHSVHWRQTRPRHMTFEIKVLDLDRHWVHSR